MLSLSKLAVLGLGLISQASAVILQNGQVRETNFPNTRLDSFSPSSYRTYPANASEISYKGRWDSKYVSWWS